MKIVYHKNVESPIGTGAEIHLFCVEISDVKRHASELITGLCDESWINKLSPVARASYERTAMRTIEALVELFKEVEDSIAKNFGEYMISLTSRDCLGNTLEHTVLPISELWKEKITNNHGFDFHTESKNQKIAFGEAKYSKTRNPYTEAAKQVKDFIIDAKDQIDATHLQHFVSGEAIENLLQGRRAFSLAFSINTPNHEDVLIRALNSDLVCDICAQADELYIIGVRA